MRRLNCSIIGVSHLCRNCVSPDCSLVNQYVVVAFNDKLIHYLASLDQNLAAYFIIETSLVTRHLQLCVVRCSEMRPLKVARKIKCSDVEHCSLHWQGKTPERDLEIALTDTLIEEVRDRVGSARDQESPLSWTATRTRVMRSPRKLRDTSYFHVQSLYNEIILELTFVFDGPIKWLERLSRICKLLWKDPL